VNEKTPPADLGAQPWRDIITAADLAVYEAAGFGRPSGLGTHPALLVIDTQYRTVGTTPAPILESIREYATSCGEIGWAAVPHIARMVAAFRARGFPVIYPHVAYKRSYDGGRFADKVPGVMSVDARGYEFVAEVAPRSDDILVPKHHPSAFFGTPLATYLVNMRVDSVVLTGCTTSGCIRATAVDAFSYGYRVAVPIECVYDRSSVSHAVNLFDMASKYADVLAADGVMARISELGAN
jgi:nicotinamidase-related amidase